MSAEETDKQDDQEIPVLRDMVDPDELSLIEEFQVTTSVEASHPAQPIDDMRESITAQLTAELQPIIDSAIHTTVEQMTGQVRQILQDELQGSLHNRMQQLIADALEREFGN